MIPAPEPANEQERIAALESYRVLDTDPELGFDDLTALASSICGTPIALVSLVDVHRQWFKSRKGLDATETPREFAFCSYTILEEEDKLLVVPDATVDERFHDNPLTTGGPFVRFYAGTPLITPQGHALGSLCVIDHIPRKLTDSQLESLRLLGRQVICQLELRKSRDLARKMAESKSSFLATMSHEVRTPLNGVLGVLQQIEETPLNEEQQELLELARRSGKHLLGVVNDILDLSRLEAGRIQLEAAPLHLRDILADVVAMTAAPAEAKNLHVNIDWRSIESDARLGDSHRLRQILLNLVSNAIKFTPNRGTITIGVSDGADETTNGDVTLSLPTTESTETPPLPPPPTRENRKKKVILSVQDTGIGIAPQVIEHLFQPFSQADCSTTRQYGGSGLGLAIVRRLTSLMHGEVSVTSVLGHGSQFTCVVALEFSPSAFGEAVGEDGVISPDGSEMCFSPNGSLASPGSEFCGSPSIEGEAITTESTKKLSKAHSYTASPRPLFDLNGRSVLVAEDDAITVKLLKRRLLKHNCKLTVVNSGAAALEACKRATSNDPSHTNGTFCVGKEGFDLIFMDGMMPEMDGYEATRNIRALPSEWTKTVPIIAMTANALDGARQKCLEAGMTDYMSKPVNFQDVNLLLQRLFGVKPCINRRQLPALSSKTLSLAQAVANDVKQDIETIQNDAGLKLRAEGQETSQKTAELRT